MIKGMEKSTRFTHMKLKFLENMVPIEYMDIKINLANGFLITL